MNCKHIQRQLTLAAELTESESEHVTSCDACTAVAAGQSAVSRSLEMVAVSEPSIGAADRAFRAAMAGDAVIKSPSFLERLLPLATPIAAGAAAAAVIALLVGSPTTQVQDSGDEDAVAAGLLSDEADDDDLGEVLALGDEQ